MPAFSGSSFIQLRKLKHGNRDITVEMSFKPMTKDGILLYAGQTFDGRGDFIALTIRNGHIEFRLVIAGSTGRVTARLGRLCFRRSHVF